MKWAVWHLNGGGATNSLHLTEVTGPFDSALAASSWAYRKWGPAGSVVVRWKVGKMGQPT